ncbi:MAG: dTMP kinase [Actinomycetota bacterium]
MTYVAFEGGEGSGKSTQARILAERIGAVLTHEPGATPLGTSLRKLLLDPDGAPVDPRTETLLMAADRAQHLAEVVRPALAEGRVVVSDRSVHSSLAYQGGGRELGVDAVRRVNDWAIDGRWPDVVVYLDVDQGSARARLDRKLDRLEQEDRSFHERIQATYRELADTEGWIRVSADGSIEEVAERVWKAVEPLVAPALRAGS